MPATISSQTVVATDVVLDGRLALFHERQRWLAVADLHFGYELSQRVAGRLVPMWGMTSIEARLSELIDDYRPLHLILLGDVVHDKAAAGEASDLIRRLGERCELIVLAGNHDRHVAASLPMLTSWASDGFYFHHGHCAAEATGRIQVIGHHHPAGSIHDGAGLRLKLPAFVQQENCWIMPAFSPWAGGVDWLADAESRIWLCTPGRILPMPKLAAAVV